MDVGKVQRDTLIPERKRKQKAHFKVKKNNNMLF